MKETSARPADRIERLVNAYADDLYRICLFRLQSAPDAEDAVQDTFLKLIEKRPVFRSEEHEKAWLIRVALNVCADRFRERARHPQAELTETLAALPEDPALRDLAEALLTLPEAYRTVLTLHYAEGYTTKEIARAIGKSASAVKMRLQKGRDLLKDALTKGE